jgi:predicted nuclease with TOPRIM domain
MAKEYFKQLQEQIEQLQDGFDIKNVEIGLLENEMQDNLRPNFLLSQLTSIHLAMLSEIVGYEIKNKPSERITVSKNRLIKLLDISTELSGIGDKMQSFKLFNRELVTRMQLLRVENAELRKKLDDVGKGDLL